MADRPPDPGRRVTGDPAAIRAGMADTRAALGSALRALRDRLLGTDPRPTNEGGPTVAKATSKATTGGTAKKAGPATAAKKTTAKPAAKAAAKPAAKKPAAGKPAPAAAKATKPAAKSSTAKAGTAKKAAPKRTTKTKSVLTPIVAELKELAVEAGKGALAGVAGHVAEGAEKVAAAADQAEGKARAAKPKGK